VFHLDVAKVDRDVAYVAMVVHVCCKGLLLMFHMCFRMYVTSVYLDGAYVSHKCCMCFIWVLFLFAKIFNCLHVFFKCFRSIISMYFKCFSCFRHIPTGPHRINS
jgi:hypothetical protein